MKKQSALRQVLIGLIPYSRQNLLLSFQPNKFFNELERSSGYHSSTLRSAYNRAAKRGMVNLTNQNPSLTKEGYREVLPFIAEQLPGGASLMVIFDIPEEEGSKRQILRRQLKDWGFQQVQKSVWSCELDYREELVDVIAELRLGRAVEIYEAARLFPRM